LPESPLPLVFGVDAKKMDEADDADVRLEHDEIVLTLGAGLDALGRRLAVELDTLLLVCCCCWFALLAEFRLARVLWTCFSIAIARSCTSTNTGQRSRFTEYKFLRS
jgi:hypothetical protein